MKNAIKVTTALKNAFPGHRVEIIYRTEGDRNCVYIDGYYVGYFEEEFFDSDYDDIELTIKAPLVSIKDFVNRAVGYEIVRAAVERGLSEWEKESQR